MKNGELGEDSALAGWGCLPSAACWLGSCHLASLCQGSPKPSLLGSSIVCRGPLRAATGSSTHVSRGWVCAQSSHLLQFSSLAGKKGDFSWEYPREITAPALTPQSRGTPPARGDLGEAWPRTAASGAVQAGGPPQGDLTTGGLLSSPASPTRPSCPWRGNGKPPTAVRARMYLFTLVHDKINHYLVRRSNCHMQCEAIQKTFYSATAFACRNLGLTFFPEAHRSLLPLYFFGSCCICLISEADPVFRSCP